MRHTKKLPIGGGQSDPSITIPFLFLIPSISYDANPRRWPGGRHLQRLTMNSGMMGGRERGWTYPVLKLSLYVTPCANSDMANRAPPWGTDCNRRTSSSRRSFWIQHNLQRTIFNLQFNHIIIIILYDNIVDWPHHDPLIVPELTVRVSQEESSSLLR